MPKPRRIAASHVTPDRTTPMPDGLAGIRQRAQFGPFVVPGPDVQLRAETLAALLADVERLLAIAEAAREYWETESEFARDVLGERLLELDQDPPQ